MEESDEETYSSTSKDGENRIKCRYKGCCTWKKTTFSLANHMLKHRRGIRCQVCNRDFWQKSALERHMSIHRKSEKYPMHLKKTMKGRETCANKDGDLGDKTLLLKLIRMEDDPATRSLYQKAQIKIKRKQKGGLDRQMDIRRKNEKHPKHPKNKIKEKDKNDDEYGLKTLVLQLIRTEEDPETRILYQQAKRSRKGKHLKLHEKRHVKETNIPEKERQFKCKVCSKSFGLKWSLELHEKNHQGKLNQETKCEKCSKVFRDPQSLIAHNVIAHNDALNEIRDKIPSHLNIKYYQKGSLECKECKRICKYRHDLKKHLHTHCKLENMKCPTNGCQRKFTKLSAILNHLRLQHGSMAKHIELNPNKFKCPRCRSLFDSQEDLQVHSYVHSKEYEKLMDNIPSKLKIESYRKDLLECKECGKAYKSRPSLRRHLFRHDTQGPYKCLNSKCEFLLPNINSLRHHLYSSLCGSKKKDTKILPRSITKKRSKINKQSASYYLKKNKSGNLNTTVRPFKCRICPKSFGLQWIKDLHEKKHAINNFSVEMLIKKNIKCISCNWLFASKGNLSQHIRNFHIKSKPICTQTMTKCKQEGCAKKFRTSKSMLIHFNIVHLVWKEAMKLRMRSNMYKCPFCSKILNSHRKFITHMRECKTKKSNGFSCNQLNCVFWANEFVEFQYHYFSHVHLDVFFQRPFGLGRVRRSCPKCAKSFSKYQPFLRHYSRCHKNDSLDCNLCNFSTSVFQEFEIHYIAHMNNEKRTEPNNNVSHNANSESNGRNIPIESNRDQETYDENNSDDNNFNESVADTEFSNEDTQKDMERSDKRLVFFINIHSEIELRRLREEENESMVREIYCKKWIKELTNEYERASISETCLTVEDATAKYLQKNALSRKRTKGFILLGCSDKENQIAGLDVKKEESVGLGLFAYGRICAERLKYLVRRFLEAECSIQPFQSIEQFDEFLPYIEGKLLDMAGELPTISKEKLESFTLPETIKLTFLGPKQSGKSTLINQIMNGVFKAEYEPTEIPEQLFKKIYMQERAVNLSILDTPGTTLGFLDQLILEEDMIAVVVYDITSMDSFNEAEQTVDYLRRTLQHQKVVLVGNKIDLELERMVNSTEADGTGVVYNVPYIERSAKAYWTALRLSWQLTDINTMQNNGMYSIPAYLNQ